MATLYVCRGYPGQGKTKFSNTEFPNIPHFENDMWFMHSGKYEYDRTQMPKAIEWCMKSVENCLVNGIDVIVSNTFTKIKFVDSYRMLAEKYKAEFKVYRMMGDFKNVHDVPENVLKCMKDNFEDYEGEVFVYPNMNQSKNDPCYRPYMFTNLKVGDIIELLFSECGTITATPPQYATVTGISQGTYDYLNVFYRKEDGSEGLCMTGECRKI